MRIAVLGAGNGGFGVAADLAHRGHKVRLYEFPTFADNLKAIRETKEIKLRGVTGEGCARLETVTTDMEVALAGADLAIAVVPAYGQRALAAVCAPYLRPEQPLVLSPGYVGGALEFEQILAAHGCQEATVAETSAFPFACRKEGDDAVWIRGIKKGILLAAGNHAQSMAVVQQLDELWPGSFTAASSILESSLNEINPVIHPPLMICNLGLFEESGVPFKLFTQGVSPGTARLMEALDEERMAILRHLKLPVRSTKDWLIHFYQDQGVYGDDLYEVLKYSPVHKAALSPTSLNHRYFTEDVSFGLVPLAAIAAQVGVDVPTIKGCVRLASAIAGQDLAVSGRELSGLINEEMFR
jgi:opine dehydrogenase